MSKYGKLRSMGKPVKVLLVANLCLWIYFWVGFATASYPYKPDPLGHPAGTGYTFWGHSIAVTESASTYRFFRVVTYLEYPSIALATLVVRVFSPQQVLYGFFAGISKGGWLLLAVMLLSFAQWYLVGWVVQTLWRKRFSPSTSTPGHAPPTQTGR